MEECLTVYKTYDTNHHVFTRNDVIKFLTKSDHSSLSKWTAPMKGNLGKSKHI